MSTLNRKLLRDLLGIKSQVMAICLVIAAAVSTFVMSRSTLQSLTTSKDSYYDHYRFAQVFARLKRAPDALSARMREIPGVSHVATRLVFDVTIDVQTMSEPAVGRLISVPEGHRPLLNDFHLRRGRYIEAGRDEVMISEPFAESHGLQPGDHLVAIVNGRRRRLEIVGIVLSPEFIIQIPGGSLMPDDRRFGILWMSYEQLAAAYDMESAFNDVSLRLMRGASEAEVIRRLDILTEPYGGMGANGRYEQVSHHYISEEIKQLKTMGLVAPTIFMVVGAFLLNVVLNRIISIQREEIATLKAFGYRGMEIAIHYTKMVLVIAFIGIVVGVLLGGWLGQRLTELYATFYRFPIFAYEIRAGIYAQVILLFGGAAMLATFSVIRGAIRLPPAEAMRPAPPSGYRATIIDRLALGRWLPQTTRMIFRQLERHPIKSLMTAVGISLATSILVVGSFGQDAITFIMHFQFNQVQRQDVLVNFAEPTSGNAIHDIGHLPGVGYCEPFRNVPTRIRFRQVSRRVGVMGLQPESQLYRLLNEDGEPVSLPQHGLLLSAKLADLLRVKAGDEITVEILEGQRLVRQVVVAGLITEFSGLNAYMNIDALRGLLREGDSISGAFLLVDENRVDDLYTTLKSTPRIAGVNIKAAALNSFEETVAENLLMMRSINIALSVVIAFGVVYNSARVSLSERSRDLATLRVMGFTRGEISAILLGELAILALFAIPAGLVLGYFFAWMATLGLDTEIFRIPLVISRSSFGLAALVSVLATVFSALVVRRKLDHLDLVAVLKSKE